ncbi:germ cell nuclear acidic protein-like [Daphnia carinata]|uniref:germ cell nuclear acidic protein-like n=1 Tax=Daphnia carinata TaxID=120202 RepID=UPI002579E711|nr:germ cell nuclear acidic protein-like [Daphnia carinata]
MSSDDDSLSPLMTMSRKKKIPFAASNTTPLQPTRDHACKLSLTKQKKAKENKEPFMTPDRASKQKVSAAFIFSSCKKKPLATSSRLPGHTILVDDSSDEELIQCDSSMDVTNANRNAETVDESLVEYSLIRKWLQNAEESSTSAEDSDVESNSFEENSRKNLQIFDRVCKLNSQTASRNPGDNTVVLSSDDEICAGLGSTLDDSFDSQCVTSSLQERLAILERPRQHVAESTSEDEKEIESEDSLTISRSYKKPLVALHISSEEEIPSSPEVKRHQSVPEIFPRRNHSPTPITIPESESELEDVFGSLTINESPSPKIKLKKVIKPRQKKIAKGPTICKQPPCESQRTFLASLSPEVPQDCRHADAIPYLKNFRKNRDELTNRLFKIFNEGIFHNHFQAEFSITWNSRLTRTAGYCRHFTKRENGSAATSFESRIELSVKVVDTPCRLRDTLVHELCHAATWMIDNCRGGHGPVWRKWANRALKIFPELPPITRCHNYEIAFKFYYNCVRCKYSVGRHSKSIDTTTHVCPMCKGQLQLSQEPSSGGAAKEEGATAKPKTPRTPNAFALFVKENYGVVKSSRADLPHAAVMKLLSAKFAESKLKLV